MLIKTWLEVVIPSKGTLALMRGTLVNYEARKFKTQVGLEGPEVKRADQCEVQAESLGDAHLHQDGDDGGSYGRGEHGV